MGLSLCFLFSFLFQIPTPESTLLPRTLLRRTLRPCAAIKRTPPTERTIQSMTLNNPPDQPSVKQITTKNKFSYTSHDHHPLTGTPFPENNTAIPATPATPTTLTTLASDPAANLASSPAIPTTPATLTTLATLATLATVDHPAANLASSPAIPTTPTTLTTLTTLTT